jgi:OOP family OmpA-OmpF porin
MSVGRLEAQPAGSGFYISPMAGYVLFDEELVYPTAPLKDNYHVGGRLGWQFSPYVALEAAGGWTPAEEDISSGADVTFWHASGNFVVGPEPGGFGAPFLSVGGGYAKFDSDAATEDAHFGTFEAAAGWRFWFGQSFGLRLEARNILDLPKKDPQDANKNQVLLLGGLTWAMGGGKPPDADGDGVPDKKDKCAGTPAGATVNADGCPSDADGDGVFDGIDRCANSPKGAQVDASGCPKDSDGDGVFDGIDQCGGTPKGARVDATGCGSDSDSDGIPDGIDQCEGTPKGAQVDEKGCPKDSDGDGVFDGLDKCPSTAAGLKVDSDGCPIEVTEKETELFDTGMIRLQNVNFETGKADLLPESYGTLDIVGQVLSKWPELRMEIGGHTDSRGSNAFNQKLSEARATSVLNYLTQKFPTLKAEQFTVKGYGESKPLVPNTSDLNMAKNRRVEFVVVNKEVLRREVERRKLLQK